MPLLTNKPLVSSTLRQTRTRSNTDPKPPKTSHSNSVSIDSGYASGWGTIHFCSKGPFTSRRTSIFTDEHLTCEGHPVIFEYGEDIKVFYIGEARITNLRDRMGKSREVLIGKSGRKSKPGNKYKKANGASHRDSQISGNHFQKLEPVRRGKMVKDERGHVRAVYEDEEPIDLGRRIARESIRDISTLLKVPLMPEKNAIDGGSKHSVRALWSWGFGN
ncbi:hypothetical protein BOTCAL_0047g00040 [Botryotinia calthae]|uniref:Uncharacterized protein n=1 Tax=Botryotinia calthae TaxID=38488 RepID=A0A4Y8DDQ6_9HELO|nr:hypothetical protein BOTCAL_0047g00040 [Botryotinia calthae]